LPFAAPAGSRFAAPGSTFSAAAEATAEALGSAGAAVVTATEEDGDGSTRAADSALARLPCTITSPLTLPTAIASAAITIAKFRRVLSSGARRCAGPVAERSPPVLPNATGALGALSGGGAPAEGAGTLGELSGGSGAP
jgi:hypothetical protein